MANLKTDSPLARRIARSFLQFLNSVEPSSPADGEELLVAEECLAEAFKIDRTSLDNQSNCDSLVDMFSSREGAERPDGNEGGSDARNLSAIMNAEVFVGTPSMDQDRTGDPDRSEHHSPWKDELFVQLFGGLEKIHYFRRMPDGNDDQMQLDRATNLFHNAVQEMQMAGCNSSDRKILADTFKSQGNKAMQAKLYAESIELYTFAIALCDDNAVYYCNRAAAYTQIRRYTEAVRDCLRSIEIDPNYSKAYSRLGFAYYSQGKYRDAIDKGFMKALQLNPNNDAVKENIRAAEQKLREEQQREGPGQSSTFTSHGQSSQYGGPETAFTSMPFNINGLSGDITSMLMNMTSNAFPGQQFQTGPEGESHVGADHEPEIRMGGNMSFNVNELPEELSGAFRSMMGRFSATSPNENQQDNNNGRSPPN
ncbi:hypothetical protein ACS0TY_028354 [Phlomoides rotata]